MTHKAKLDPEQLTRSSRAASPTAPRKLLWRAFVLLALMLQAVTLPSLWAQSKVDEYHMKAAFLFHFSQLVEWPQDALGQSGDPMVLCTLGEDPFDGQLESTVAGKRVGARTLLVRHAKSLKDASNCNLLFISRSEGSRIPLLLATLRNTPVLTVSDAEGFLVSGGVIRIYLEEKKIRFEINREAAESAKLKISSQLLLLAVKVMEGTGKK